MPKRPPLLTDSPSELLDHMKICALTDPDGNASASQLRSDLSITGSQDAMAEDEDYDRIISEDIEGVVDAALTEAEFRIRACGSDKYPFRLERMALLRNDTSMTSVYAFLLLLSRFGEDAVPRSNGSKLFEDLCAHAMTSYLGGSPAESHVFGFPRRIGPKDFVGAVTDLCERKICEGEADSNFPGAQSMKDAASILSLGGLSQIVVLQSSLPSDNVQRETIGGARDTSCSHITGARLGCGKIRR